jgi:hydrogenase expression/formation protein HypC
MRPTDWPRSTSPACGVVPGDWVLIHVGFAISKVDEEEARATRDLLVRMGADYEQELEELKASVIE